MTAEQKKEASPEEAQKKDRVVSQEEEADLEKRIPGLAGFSTD